MQVDTCKNLEETVHLHVTHLCKDSTFDFFFIFFKFFFKNLSCLTQGAAYLQAQLINRYLRYLISHPQFNICKFLIPHGLIRTHI